MSEDQLPARDNLNPLGSHLEYLRNSSSSGNTLPGAATHSHSELSPKGEHGTTPNRHIVQHIGKGDASSQPKGRDQSPIVELSKEEETFLLNEVDLPLTDSLSNFFDKDQIQSQEQHLSFLKKNNEEDHSQEQRILQESQNSYESDRILKGNDSQIYGFSQNEDDQLHKSSAEKQAFKQELSDHHEETRSLDDQNHNESNLEEEEEISILSAIENELKQQLEELIHAQTPTIESQDEGNKNHELFSEESHSNQNRFENQREEEDKKDEEGEEDSNELTQKEEEAEMAYTEIQNVSQEGEKNYLQEEKREDTEEHKEEAEEDEEEPHTEEERLASQKCFPQVPNNESNSKQQDLFLSNGNENDHKMQSDEDTHEQKILNQQEDISLEHNICEDSYDSSKMFDENDSQVEIIYQNTDIKNKEHINLTEDHQLFNESNSQLHDTNHQQISHQDYEEDESKAGDEDDDEQEEEEEEETISSDLKNELEKQLKELTKAQVAETPVSNQYEESIESNSVDNYNETNKMTFAAKNFPDEAKNVFDNFRQIEKQDQEEEEEESSELTAKQEEHFENTGKDNTEEESVDNDKKEETIEKYDEDSFEEELEESIGNDKNEDLEDDEGTDAEKYEKIEAEIKKLKKEKYGKQEEEEGDEKYEESFEEELEESMESMEKDGEEPRPEKAAERERESDSEEEERIHTLQEIAELEKAEYIEHGKEILEQIKSTGRHTEAGEKSNGSTELWRTEDKNSSDRLIHKNYTPLSLSKEQHNYNPNNIYTTNSKRALRELAQSRQSQEYGEENQQEEDMNQEPVGEDTQEEELGMEDYNEAMQALQNLTQNEKNKILKNTFITQNSNQQQFLQSSPHSLLQRDNKNMGKGSTVDKQLSFGNTKEDAFANLQEYKQQSAKASFPSQKKRVHNSAQLEQNIQRADTQPPFSNSMDKGHSAFPLGGDKPVGSFGPALKSLANQRPHAFSQIRRNNYVNFENFDPFNKNSFINSPRSLEICKRTGVLRKELYYQNISEIKSRFSQVYQFCVRRNNR